MGGLIKHTDKLMNEHEEAMGGSWAEYAKKHFEPMHPSAALSMLEEISIQNQNPGEGLEQAPEKERIIPAVLSMDENDLIAWARGKAADNDIKTVSF